MCSLSSNSKIYAERSANASGCEFGVLNSTEGFDTNAKFYIDETLCGYSANDGSVSCPPNRVTDEADFFCVKKNGEQRSTKAFFLSNVAGIDGVDVIIHDVEGLRAREKAVIFTLECSSSSNQKCKPLINYING